MTEVKKANTDGAGYEFQKHGDDFGDLSESEARFLSMFPNDNTERALAIEIVRLSRKVK